METKQNLDSTSEQGQNSIYPVEELNQLKKSPLLFYIKQNPRAFSLGIFFLLITNGLDAYYPLILKNGIDLVLKRGELSELGKISATFFAIMAILAISRYCWRTFFGQYHTRAAEDLRNRIFSHLTKMGGNFFNRAQVGEIMSLAINDVQSFRMGIGSGLLILIDGFMIMGFVLPFMIFLNPAWTWKTMILLPLVPVLIWQVNTLIYKRFKTSQEKLADLSSLSQEIVAGIRVIKSFVQEKNRLGIYNKLSRDYEISGNRVAIVESLFVPVMQFGVASGTVILLFVASPDLLSGAISIGTFVAFQRYIAKMVWPMTALGLGLSQMQKGKAAFTRILELLETKTDIIEKDQIEIANEEFKTLEVKNLSFHYPKTETAALRNISFKVSKGETLGIVGPVGSGKTTLINLLTRIYPAPENTIFINGIPIEKISLQCVRRLLTLIPQDPFLFSDTISNNLQFGLQNKISEAEIKSWAGVIDLEEEIESLPQKYTSQLGERGVNLSGGQKQRLTIARGLVVRSPVIIMDDNLSAIDTKTEAKIEHSLDAVKDSDQTRIIISHRLSTLKSATKILVLNLGQIESFGAHQELLGNSKIYQELYQLQNSKGSQVEELS